MRDKAIRRFLGFFLLISAVLVVVAVLAVRNINRSADTSDWVNHTHEVILEAEGLRSALYAADGSWHTYMLTGDARDLSACRAALSNVDDLLEITEALTRNEPAQHEKFVQLRSLLGGRMEFIQQAVAARQGGKMETVRNLVSQDQAGTAMRDIEKKIDALKNEELGLLTQRDSASYLQAQATRCTVWTGVAVDMLLLGGVAWLIRDDIGARRRAVAALQVDNDRLEARVAERTAELVSANSRLTMENLERQWSNKALEHQLRYNHLIVDSISDLVIVVTKAMRISRLNPAVTHLTGLEAPALIDEPLSKIVRLLPAPGGADAPLLDPLAAALREGRDLRDQPASLEDVRGRGTKVRLNLFPLRDRDKVIGGVVTVHTGDAPGGAGR